MKKILRVTLALALAGFAVVTAPTVAMAAPPTPGCSYGTNGAGAATLCWIDFSGYDQAQAQSSAGQDMTIDLPGNRTLSFNIKDEVVPGAILGKVKATTTPLWPGADFGTTIYAGLSGKVGMYQSVGAGDDLVTLSNIQLKDGNGNPTMGYGIAMADIESTGNGESLYFSSDQTLTQVVQQGNPAVCGGGLSGLGTTSVKCVGVNATDGKDLVVKTNTPSWVSIQLNSKNVGLEGVAFALQTASVAAHTVVNGRPTASDSFSTSISTSTDVVAGPASTGAYPSTSATAGPYIPYADTPGLIAYTLKQTVDGTTNLAHYTTAWSCLDNGLPFTDFTTSPDGQSITLTPSTSDGIDCTITNTYVDNIQGGTSASTWQDTPVTTPLASIAHTSAENSLDPTAVTQTTAPSHGSISIDPATGAVKYTPEAGYSGADSYVVNVCDHSAPAQCADMTVAVTVNPAPVVPVNPDVVTAQDKSVVADSGKPVTMDPGAGATSSLSLPLTKPTIVGGPKHGRAVANPDGTVTYTPDPGYQGDDSFTYQVCDTGNPVVCDVKTVTVQVKAAAVPPTPSPTVPATPSVDPAPQPVAPSAPALPASAAAKNAEAQALPDTGGPNTGWGLGGTGLLLIGLGLITASRRREA